MTPTPEEIDRVARLLHDAAGDFTPSHDYAHSPWKEFDDLSAASKLRYHHVALAVINDLWARWNPAQVA